MQKGGNRLIFLFHGVQITVYPLLVFRSGMDGPDKRRRLNQCLKNNPC